MNGSGSGGHKSSFRKHKSGGLGFGGVPAFGVAERMIPATGSLLEPHPYQGISRVWNIPVFKAPDLGPTAVAQEGA